MKARLNSIQEVEQALNIRLGGGSKPSDAATSWEFRGAKSLKNWMRRSGRSSGARSGSSGRSFTTNPRQQRVIVKASYIAYREGKVAAVLRAHVKYLGRDSASLDGLQGRFYDADREGVNAKQRVQEWQIVTAWRGERLRGGPNWPSLALPAAAHSAQRGGGRGSHAPGGDGMGSAAQGARGVTGGKGRLNGVVITLRWYDGSARRSRSGCLGPSSSTL